MKLKTFEVLRGIILVLMASNGLVTAQNGVGVNTSTPLSYLEVNGSFAKVATTVTANTALDATNSIIVCNNGATAISITLPAANTCSGRIYEIKRNNTSVANVTITATVDGSANPLLTLANQSLIVFSDGTNWRSIGGYTPLNTSAWAILGNSGTVSATNFIGTTDAQDLVVRTNNTEKIRVESGGNVGIGENNPNHKLHVNGDIGMAGDTRRGIVKVYNEATGDVFGLENVSAAQTGTQAGIRLFTSSAGSAHIGFGKYTSTTAYTEYGRFQNNGSLAIGTTTSNGWLTVEGPVGGASIVTLRKNAVESNIYIGTSIGVPNPGGSTLTNATGIHYFDVMEMGKYSYLVVQCIPTKTISKI